MCLFEFSIIRVVVFNHTSGFQSGLCFLRHVGVSPIAAMKPHCGYDSE